MTVVSLRRPRGEAELAAVFAEHDRDASFPFESFELLAEAGLLGLTVPARLGGRGAGLAEAARVVGATAAGEPSTALVLAMHLIQHSQIRRPDRFPAHLATRLGREAVAGVSLIKALRVEPELGTPARGGLPATTARRTGAGWRISGRKIFSTAAPILSWYLVWARTDDPEPLVGAFLVSAGLPGIGIEPTWDQLGMRATGSHDVILDEVEVPVDHAIDLRPPAQQAPDAQMWAWNTVMITAVYDGIARAAVAWLAGWLHERRPSSLSAALATLPRCQSVVGEIEGLLTTNRRLIASVAADVDRDAPPSVAESGSIKRVITNNAVAAVEKALSLTGNAGLSRSNPLERHYRDVLCGRIHTPQDDSAVLAAGRAALGLP